MNGRVMDPETQTDRVANVGIRQGQIARITSDNIKGKQLIDARGLVVAPGFIDIHSHTPTRLGEHLSILDGITTQLDLEAGSYPPTSYGYQYRGGAQLHYGSSVGHFAIRGLVMEGASQSYFFDETGFITLGGDMWRKQATPAQVEAMRKHLRNGLDLGGLGIGVLLDYMTEAVSESELSMIFATAAEYDKPVYVHVRRGMPGDPTGLDEIIALAESHGVATLICHITHSAMGGIEDWLLKALAWPGMMVSTDALPAFDIEVKTNPNIAGTYAQFLGRYVRELKVMPLMEGLRRITLLPAQWLALASDDFSRKGRIQVGADADIVIFDAGKISPQAQYGDPYKASQGIYHVLVGGRPVVTDGEQVEGRYPGKHLLAPTAR